MPDRSSGFIVSPAGMFPLLASGPAQWTFTEGTSPSIGVFDMIPAHAKALLGSPKLPVTLRISTGSRDIDIEQLWVEGIRPGPNKFILQIKLADRRRFLKYCIATGRYNIKREIGVRRIQNNVNPELRDVSPIVWYAAYSLKNPQLFPADVSNKWTPTEMLKDVFKKATDIEKQYTGHEPALVIKPEIEQLDKTLAVEDLTIDESGDMALDQAVRYIPEAGLWVNKKGEYVIYSKVNGREKQLVESLGEEIANMGHIEFIDNSNVCPGEIEVYWPIESELRFDYIEQESGGTQVAIVDQRQMVNIVPVPDFQLPLTGGANSVAQGTWLELNDILARWGVIPGGSPLTVKTLRKMIPGYVDLYGMLSLSGATDPNHDWAGRLATIMNHFRLTFKLPPRWIDRMLSFRPYRVGIADVVNQIRASSQAWCDFYRLSTMRSFFKNKAQNENLQYSINAKGYPTGDGVPWDCPGAKLMDGKMLPCPANIEVVDPDQGIIHLAFKADMVRVYEVTGPGQIGLSDGSTIGPTANFSQADYRPVTFDMIFDTGKVPELYTGFKLAVILTAVPASPNNLKQFYKITVKPKDVQDLLPPEAQTWLEAAKGPTWQTRVSAGLNGGHAMLRWDDSRWADFERLFGVQDGDPNLEGLVVNRNTTEVSREGLTAPNLDNLSRALAARIWARFADRLQGSMAGYLQGEAELDGWATGLHVSLDPKGVVVTGVSLPESLPQLPFENLLDQSTKNILSRSAQPVK